MGIWAEIKKSINSNLEKPLNITLDEIKSAIDEGAGSPVFKVETVVGIPYNETANQQVLSLDDAPIVSVSGRGRILQIVPVSNKGNTSVYGTTLLTVDDKVLLNNMVLYGSTGVTGKYLVDFMENHTNVGIYVDAFGTITSFKATSPSPRISSGSVFFGDVLGIIAPNGIPFKNGFELKLTQNYGLNNTDQLGVIVIYEVYE